MKIYVVTSGEYSNYGIDAVFTDPDKAKKYANLDMDRMVEEYDADTADISMKSDVSHPNILSIGYNVGKNEIYTLSLTTNCDDAPDKIETGWSIDPVFRLYVGLNERIWNDVIENGNKSQILMKVVQDRLAVKLDQLGMSREELVRKCHEERERLTARYSTLFATTSGDMTSKQ